MISIDRIDCFESLEGIKPAWKELLGKSDVDVIFLTPEWLGAWWKVYGEDRELYFLLVKSDDALIGIAPLMAGAGSGRSGRVIEFIGVPNADYSDIIAEDKPLVWKHVMAYLDEHRREWTKISLTQIPDRSSSLTYFRGPGQDGRRLMIREIESCTQYVYDGPESDRAAFEFKRSRTVKTAVNVFQRSGGIVCERLKDVASCNKYLPMLFQLHISRWEMTPTPSKFLEEKHRLFYSELLDRLDPANICFFFVKNGNVPIACSFNYEYNNTINFYTLAINQYFKKRSPGQVLFVLQGETFVRQGYELDYSRGAHEYKYMFANRNSLNYQVNVFARSLEYSKARLVERIKKTEPVASLLKSEKFAPTRVKIVQELEKNGIKGLAGRFFGRLGELFKTFVVNYREFYVFKFGDLPEQPIKPKLPIKVKRLTVADVDRIATFYGAWEDSPKHRTILSRFEKKADCYAAFYRGNIIAVCWGLYHADHHGGLGLTITPESDEVLITDGIATPIYRGMKIAPFMVSQMLSDYYPRGLKAIGGIARANKSSLKAFSVFDLKRMRTIKYLKILGIRII